MIQFECCKEEKDALREYIQFLKRLLATHPNYIGGPKKDYFEDRLIEMGLMEADDEQR